MLSLTGTEGQPILPVFPFDNLQLLKGASSTDWIRKGREKLQKKTHEIKSYKTVNTRKIPKMPKLHH
jgi:hypothetical protein